MVIIDIRQGAPAPAEHEMQRVVDEFFRQRPARRPASEIEVLLLSEALGLGEALIRRHLLQTMPSRVARRSANSRSTRPSTAGWRCIPGTRGERDITDWP